MMINVNGRPVEAGDSATIADVIGGQPYVGGSAIALIKSAESITKETNEFDLVTARGRIGLRLNDSKYAGLFRELVKEIKGRTIRWQTSKVMAIGSFPTQIEVSHEPGQYQRYDCFFALGGFDSRTSYIMIAKTNHEGAYGATGAVLGKITRGRHILGELQEGEAVLDIVPVVEEISERDSTAVTDLGARLEPGMSVETFVAVKLDPRSPTNGEHFLVASQGGTVEVSQRTEAFDACSTHMDVSLIAEASAIREPGMVTVRHEGVGMGRIYFYKQRRQVAASHTLIGTVTQGMELLRIAPEGARLTVVPDPRRALTIGQTQAEGQKFLEGFGLRQRRTGDQADDAVIVEQEPELTLEALREAEIETLGVRPEKINDITIDPSKAPQTARYVRKMTGLNHKPIGTMKVHFTFPEMPLITFDGNYGEAGSLVPENEFKEACARGEMAVTNMSRPNRGLIGIRLEASDEFGPTGEERYGSNMFGKMLSDLDRLMANIQEGDIIYVREVQPPPAAKRPARKAKPPAEGAEATKPEEAKDGAKPKTKRTRSKAKGEENGQGK